MDAYLLEAVRAPFGRHRGGLAGIRTDDLAALPIAEVVRRYPGACRELRRRGAGYAVAAACVGVGQGTAMVVRVR